MSRIPPPERRLTRSVAETAQILGVSEDVIYDGVKRGDIPAIRVGSRILIPVKSIDAMIERAIAEAHGS